MLLAASCLHAQYTIKGDIKGLRDCTMYLQCRGQNVDSAQVRDGKFAMAGSWREKGAGYVYLTNAVDWGMALWMFSTDNVQVEGDATDENTDVRVKGSRTEDEYGIYQKMMTPTWEEGRAIQAQIDKDVAKFDSLQHLLNDVYQPKEDSAFMAFARQYPSSYITLNHIYNWRVLNKYPYAKYSAAAKVLTPGAFEGKQWETFRHFLEVDSAMEVGQPFPQLTVNDVYGQPLSVASFKGKYLLLTISTYGISDYNSDLTLRRELYDKYHGKGLEMMDYQLTTDIINLMKAPANYGLKWHFASDLKSWNNPWLKEHEIDHITQNFLIDRQGRIIAKMLFGEELKREIERLF